MSRKRVLAVAGPEWRSALLNAAGDSRSEPLIVTHDAAAAVTLLATEPASFTALALEAAAGGIWLPTLLDLTQGDTDRPVPLLILGQDHTDTQHRLLNAASLQLPVDNIALNDALSRAHGQSLKTSREIVSPGFPNIQSIRVRYQPLVRLKDLRPVTVEVLARVLMKDGKLAGPDYIIAAMTNSENAMRLTSLIVQMVISEDAEGELSKLGLNFAFNLPLDAMVHPDLINNIEIMRSKTKIQAKGLGFELTESQPVEDFVRTGIIIMALHQAGYRLALDDVTPATPGLDALLQLPFRGIKLDRSVVTGAAGTDAGLAQTCRDFISRIVAGAQQRRQAVIAEGIEKLTTLEIMRELGVTHGQGYLFARPLPARALRPWLEHWTEAHPAHPD